MGNNSSHKRTKVPKQVGKKRPPDVDKALGKQQFFSHFRQKPGTKIVLLFSTDERQQLAEAAVGPVAWPGQPSEESVGVLVGSLAAAPPRMRGAGDGAQWHEGARAGARDDPGRRRAAEGGGAPRSGRGRGRGRGLGQGRAGQAVAPRSAW
ncbi:uncharacterized protein C20orf144 homolog [Eptesicus fuscus]|uniref:uncharacterized protein C20orf144 homolog n=1 Tax=Eptesicus fuscus TaxID=29078 RepID=UPI0024047943|nr:uncharacterized protein C20orf144 homolog [Eptesicus fuscus]